MLDQVWVGDSTRELRRLADESVDLVVTDPPYGYSFMGKDWDKAVPSVDLWREVLRVLKPGAFAFVMSAPRSDVQGQMIVRLTEAGFRMDFTPIYWTYASGFPKAGNIGKLVDNKRNGKDQSLDGSYAGFQPKPAVEVILVAMKPLSEKTFVDQALANGKGITWLDDCRVPTQEPRELIERDTKGARGNTYDGGADGSLVGSRRVGLTDEARFPANLLVSDDALNGHSKFFDLDAWAKTLPFLAVPKAAKSEKGDDNNHPTVKPLKLMSYLVTLGSRPGDVVLDPFLGSGTTAIAAKQLDRRYIGIELSLDYAKIALARLAAVRQAQPRLAI